MPQVRTQSAVQRRPMQAEGPDHLADPLGRARQGVSGPGAALPHQERIQESFGRFSLDGIRAHTDSQAAQATGAMDAHAYATGSQVAFAPGHADLFTSAHEAAHVVQQRAGVQLSGGMGQSGDRYERHADAVAGAVVRGESAEPLLAEFDGGGGGEAVQACSSCKKDKVQAKEAPTKAAPSATDTEEHAPGEPCCLDCHFDYEEQMAKKHLPLPLYAQLLKEHAALNKAGHPAAAVEAHAEREMGWFREHFPDGAVAKIDADHEKIKTQL